MSNDQFATTLESAKQWIKNDSNTATLNYVSVLINKAEGGDEASMNELTSLFPRDGSRIAFGTAGLRSRMMAGPLGMNDLVIVQTAQGIARYCLKQHSNDNAGENLRAVVGYDHRENPALNLSSLSFAILTSLVFEEAGIDCVLLDGFIFTPMVPYVLQKIGAAVGVMITASHNPKDDAGYKVYASDGCQIRSPMDTEIATEILGNLEPWKDYAKLIETRQQTYADPCLGLSQPEKTQEMLSAYFESLKNSGLLTGQAKTQQLPNSLTPPSIVYTAMHGVGYNFAVKAFETFGFPPFQTVVEQRDPDPEFSTVPFPNPEEKGALDLAKKFAQENGCDIVLANDPDADRLAVAELDRTSNAWTVFTGDQIGVLLGLWIWEQVGKNCGKPVSMCASTVSSKLLAEIAHIEGFRFEETLTGFKWIGARAAKLTREEGFRNLFCYEEAIGYCCGDVIFDKDGISAMAVFTELACWVYRHGSTLTQHLQSIYDKYGEFVSHNGYFILKDPAVINVIMNHIRQEGKYNVNLSPYQVESIRDLGVPSYDSTTEDKKPTLPTSKSSPMITLKFTNGCVAQFRASGTEPKFKYYIELKGEPGVPRETVAKEVRTMAELILEKLLEPSKNGLV